MNRSQRSGCGTALWCSERTVCWRNLCIPIICRTLVIVLNEGTHY